MYAVIVVRLVPYIVFSGLLALTNPGNKKKMCVSFSFFFFGGGGIQMRVVTILSPLHITSLDVSSLQGSSCKGRGGYQCFHERGNTIASSQYKRQFHLLGSSLEDSTIPVLVSTGSRFVNRYGTIYEGDCPGPKQYQ